MAAKSRSGRFEILLMWSRSEPVPSKEIVPDEKVRVWGVSVRRRIPFGVAAMFSWLFVIMCQRVIETEGVAKACVKVVGTDRVVFRWLWPKLLQVLGVLNNPGLVLAAIWSFCFLLHGMLSIF